MPNDTPNKYFSKLSIRRIIDKRKPEVCTRVANQTVTEMQNAMEEYADKLMDRVNLIMKNGYKKTLTEEHIKSAKSLN